MVSVIGRFLAALLLVYATFNPEGYSYYHWAIRPLVTPGAHPAGSAALKFLAGIVLLIGWIAFLKTTRRSLGLLGVVLAAAVCVGLIWLLIEMNVLSAGNTRGIIHLGLIVTAIILAVGMSWSKVSQKVTGQVDTDTVA